MKTMPDEYLELARERVDFKLEGYTHPEDYGYDFRTWVSPYTKGANKYGGIAVVLQDWFSHEGLSAPFNPSVQKHGRIIGLKTNVRLEELLHRIFGLSICDVYGTNVFPLIKPGSISSRVPIKYISSLAKNFLAKELELAKPELVIALGNAAYCGLCRAGIRSIHVPHPAARIGNINIHEGRWRQALEQVGDI